ncbi:MAG: site-specific integrase, partial [Chloroflexi bacterium]|nr:site-specific integrase [Chloroflexota bacterium]
MATSGRRGSVLRQRMLEDLQLRGLSAKTQEAYVRTVRQLAEYYGKAPDRISEEELRQYFLYLEHEKKVSLSTYRIALYGIKFFFEQTLGREWQTLTLMRPRREKKLPVVLSVEEVSEILSRVQRWRYRACLTVIYGCGLRVGEGVRLRVAAVDGERMMVHVR